MLRVGAWMDMLTVIGSPLRVHERTNNAYSGDTFEPVMRAIDTAAELAGEPDLDELLAARTSEGGLPPPPPYLSHPFRTPGRGEGFSRLCMERANAQRALHPDDPI